MTVSTPLHRLLSLTKYFYKVKYTFTEGANLLICIILLLISLAFADNTFKSELSEPEQIYKLVIPSRKSKIRI